MSTETQTKAKRSNAYELFILVLSIFSLVVMVALVFPLNQATTQLLIAYDNVICLVFLLDFAKNLRSSKPRRAYFIDRRGWLDLLGSIPALGFFKYAALLRLARLSRIIRIARLFRGPGKREIARDVLRNRGQYAAFITLFAGFLVICIASAFVLQFESRASDANITTSGDALWWALVTITTVGYGDFYPITAAGRITGAFVMFAGVGIIGSLASILASILVAPGSARQEGSEQGRTTAEELADLRLELTALRRALAPEPSDPSSD